VGGKTESDIKSEETRPTKIEKRKKAQKGGPLQWGKGFEKKEKTRKSGKEKSSPTRRHWMSSKNGHKKNKGARVSGRGVCMKGGLKRVTEGGGGGKPLGGWFEKDIRIRHGRGR